MPSENLLPLKLVGPDDLTLDADFSPLGIALYKVLQRRRSSREFGPGELSLYKLSRLLWAAFGINRPEQGLRTAPSCANQQEIDIYLALPAGVYRYDANQLLLHPVRAGDCRATAGGQDYVARAPLDLIYVARFHNDQTAMRTEQQFYAALDTGFISQNVYLFCAAEGLATVVRGWIDRAELGVCLGLAANQMVVAAQSVGMPLGWPPDAETWAANDGDSA